MKAFRALLVRGYSQWYVKTTSDMWCQRCWVQVQNICSKPDLMALKFIKATELAWTEHKGPTRVTRTGHTSAYCAEVAKKKVCNCNYCSGKHTYVDSCCFKDTEFHYRCRKWYPGKVCHTEQHPQQQSQTNQKSSLQHNMHGEEVNHT